MMPTQVLDMAGALQLIDTGKRCSVRSVCMHCTREITA
jgi:hypothetical protein